MRSSIHDALLVSYSATCCDERTYGWSSEEAIGEESHALLRTRFPKALEKIKNHLLTENYWEGELEHTTRDGTRVVMNSRWILQRDGNGEPAAVLEINSDVTERKLVEEKLHSSEELFRKTFESAGVGMAHVTPDGRWLRANDKLCEILGYSREELFQMTFLELILPKDRSASVERGRRMLEGRLGPCSANERYICKNGSRVWIALSVSLAHKTSGDPDFFIYVAKDITERKISELVPEPLTSREMYVLRRIVEGQTNPQIAKALCHSLGTVKLDVQNILRKLGAGHRKEAVNKATEIGLIVSSSC